MSREIVHKLNRTVKMCPYPCKSGQRKFHYFSYAICNDNLPVTNVAHDHKLVTCKHCLRRLKVAEELLGELLKEKKP